MPFRRGYLIFALGLMVLIGPSHAMAQTVEGPVDEAGKDYLVVEGTRFSVDEETRVRPLARQNFPGAEVSAGKKDSTTRWVSYRPALFADVAGARVKGTGRLAEEIRILPYGWQEGAE